MRWRLSRAWLRASCASAIGLLVAHAVVEAQQSEGRAGFVPLGPGATARALDAPVSISITAPLRVVVSRIAAQAAFGITFDDSLPGLDRLTTLNADRLAARIALDRVLSASPLQALVSPSGHVVLVRRPPRVVRSAHLGGTVQDAESGLPVSGARIELVGTRFSAYSEQTGTFDIRLPSGDYAIRVNRLGYEPVAIARVHVSDEPADQTPVAIGMRRGSLSLSEIIVTPGYFGLLQSSLAAPQSLSREQLETIPQIGEDIYRAVSRLPGVTADDFSAKFSVRGGSGDELYVSLDGLELVEPFHLKDVGGAFSIVDIQALGSASLTTGGFSAEYGDRLSGVFTLETADPRTDRVRTSVGVSLMNARVTSQGGFAKGKGGWLVSARPGFLDLALKLTDIRDSIKPRYYDLFAKAQYDLGRGGRVALHALRAHDDLRYVQSEEPSIFSDYSSSYGWLTWEIGVASRLKVRSVASVGSLDWQRNGNLSGAGVLPERIHDDRSLHRTGVRQDWTFDVAPRFLLKWGLDAKRESASYDYFSAITVAARDSLSTDRTDTTAVVAAPRTSKLALYLAPRVQILPSLTVELGLRWDRITHVDESILSPRLNASWEPRTGTTLRAAWGRYSQSPALFGLQAQDGVSTFTPSERAEQRIVGVEQLLPFGLTGRIEGYERRRTRSHSEFVNVGGDILLFPELSWDRVRVDREGGRDRGLELQASRANGRRTDWSVGYALASADDSIGGRMVPRSMDQRHAVHADWSFRPASNAWRLSVGGVWHSGWPATPTDMVIDTITNTPQRFSIHSERTPGALNSIRLRAYHRVDARWTRYIDTGGGRVSIFGEVYNLLGTVNARGLFRRVEVHGRNVLVITEEITQWPRLPLAGFTWEF
ncbi:MAG TPA: TonB-dependent receptor [Gemmatimonadaceae bacterium]|nr:TonB-dependent receptor [Gemmatimonadaceae bacterium]